MTPEQEVALQEHLDAIAQILYEETEEEELNNLEKIEEVVRDKILSHVSPVIGFFLSKKQQEPIKAEKEN